MFDNNWNELRIENLLHDFSKVIYIVNTKCWKCINTFFGLHVQVLTEIYENMKNIRIRKFINICYTNEIGN